MESRARRSSGLELLRVMAMLMVFAHHFVLYNGVSIWEMPFTTARLFLTVGMLDMGVVGVLVFFTITAWFLSGSSGGGGRQSLRRIWMMEREVLFYSIGLYLVFRFVGSKDLVDGDGWRAIMPLSRAWRWYPTAYATFIILEPLVRRGLRAMGRVEHALLAATVVLMWGVFQGLSRDSSFTRDPVVVFVVMYVVICYVRWYYDNLPAKVAAGMVTLGLSALVVQAVRGGLLRPEDAKMSTWLASRFQLPMMLIAIGLVSLFARLDFKSAPINCLAGSTFAAYLISEHNAVRPLLWKGLFVFGDWVSGPLAVPISIGCVVLAYAMCTLADVPRRILFRLTVDRAPGALFERIWCWLEVRLPAAFCMPRDD